MSRHYIPVSRGGVLTKKESLGYPKGYNSNIANDVVPEDQLIYATDNRIPTLGRQKTRQGCDFYSVPAGETVDAQQTSATGAADQTIGLITWKAKKWTAIASGRLTKVELRLKNTASATGPVIVEVYSDVAGSPGVLLAQSSIPASTPTGSYAYLAARFIEAPLVVAASSYWSVAYIQDDGSNTYSWSSTTNATTAKASANSGVSWSATTYDLNHKAYISTSGGVLGHYRARKSDGTKVTLEAHKEPAGTTAVSIVNDVTGVLTAIKTGLSANAVSYDFEQVGDVVYYVNGVDAPRKWDFTTESAMGGSPPIARKIRWHKNHMFLLRADDPARADFSDVASPEIFTSTNFIYIPATKSSDPVVGWAVLNDNMYFLSETKWGLYGSDLTNMVLRNVPGSKGTIAPDTIVEDGNYIYFAGYDNFYAFNGSTDIELATDILGDYRAATNRDDMSAVVRNGRLYIFYTAPGSSENDNCWVINLTFKSIESNDTATYIQKCRVWSGQGDTYQFVQGSNLVGALYYAEDESNSYNNLGHKMTFEIRTKYDHDGNPASNKQTKRWYPRFTASTGNYSAEAQYDKDFADTPATIDVPLQGGGYILGGPELLGDFEIGITALIDPRLNVPGLAKYLQLRYRCAGVNKPAEYLGHTRFYNLRRAR